MISDQRQAIVDALEAERYGRPVRGVKPRPRPAEPVRPDDPERTAERRQVLHEATRPGRGSR